MFRRRLFRILLGPSVFALGSLQIDAATSHGDLIKTISAVGSEGAGNGAAASAWRELAAQDVRSVLPILGSLDAANELSANWLRSALETIVSRTIAKGGQLPVADLEKFLADKSHQPKARRLAYELLTKADASRAAKLLPAMIDDPGSELRRDAVALELQKAESLQTGGKTNEARTVYKGLMTKARDVDQIDGIVKTLRKLGETVDVAKAFGFVTEWKVIGPFDSVGGKGFDAVYPPETKVDLAAEHDGKSGKVRWRDFATKEDYGDVGMNVPFTKLKGAGAYAYTEFYSDQARPVELRLGSENAFKVWLNGKFLFGQNEYHRMKEIDQYTMRTELKAGRNEILVKVLQNEQTEDWADGWDFQLRVCDPLGAAIVSAKGDAR